MTIIVMLVAFVVAAGLAQRFCNPSSRLHILDYPNERSLHERPIPRSGGVAVLGGMMAGGAVVQMFEPVIAESWWVLLVGLGLVALVSFIDDRWDVHPLARILVHFVAAGLVVGAGFAPSAVDLPAGVWTPEPVGAAALFMLFMVWMINLYNFMDGMDGFAGGMAIIGFATFAVLGFWTGAKGFAFVCLAVVGAAAGFLAFNFPPARIFLGDTGSSSLGFLAAALSLWASRDGLFPLWLALLIFSPFIVDATVTLLRRLARGEKIWRPHKTHYYQRLVRMGWGHRRTLLAEYVLMASCSLSALFALHLPDLGRIVLAAIWLLIYVLLMAGVERLERQHQTLAAP